MQREAWWESVTILLLELVRRRLREIVHLADRGSRMILYTNVEDEAGQGDAVSGGATASGGIDLEIFRRQARALLRGRKDTVALVKLRQAIEFRLHFA